MIGVAAGLLAGGGLRGDAAIQQEVGINGFDGTTFRRQRVVSPTPPLTGVAAYDTCGADSNTPTTIRCGTLAGGAANPSITNGANVVGPVSFSLLMGLGSPASLSFETLRSFNNNADGIATSIGTTALATTNFLYGFSTVGWDRLRTVSAGNGVGTGLLAAGMYAHNGTNAFDRVSTVQAAGDGTAVGLLATGTYGFNGATWDRARNSFSQSVAGITANGAGATVAMTTTPMHNYSLHVIRTAGATDVVDIRLECSVDGGTNFIATGTAVTSVTGGSGRADRAGTPCSAMRYNVVTVGAGNTLTAQLLATR